jgi:hypothetical protein
MTTTPDGGRTFHDSKSNLALTKSDNSSADAELAAHVEKPPQAPAPSPFPEGGLQAWLTVLGGYVSSPCQTSFFTCGLRVAYQVHDTFLHLRHGAVIRCIPGILLRRHFQQPAPNSSLTSVVSRITFRNTLLATSAGLVQYRPSYSLLEVYPPGSYLMKGESLRYPVLM